MCSPSHARETYPKINLQFFLRKFITMEDILARIVHATINLRVELNIIR